MHSISARAGLAAGLALGALALLGGPAASLALSVGQATGQAPPVDATVQGANPHGQGTVLAVTVGGSEAVVVGRSRGEQQPGGAYHGHTTTLALLGHDVIAGDTTPGQTAKGPLAPLQEQLLDPICQGSGGNVCVEALRADSATTTTGSENHSRLAGAALGGKDGVAVVAGDSNGDIRSNGDCQVAHGDVTLLKLMLGGNPLVDIGESASDSNACPSGTTTHNSGNPLVAIGGQGLPLPGCGADSPGYLVDLSPLLTLACNAGSQAGAGGIVNDALAGTVLANGSSPAGALVAGGTGAAAQPPAQQALLGARQAGKGRRSSSGATSTTAHARKPGRSTAASGPPRPARTARPLGPRAAGRLPLTGTDVVVVLMAACCLLGGGLALRRRSVPS